MPLKAQAPSDGTSQSPEAATKCILYADLHRVKRNAGLGDEGGGRDELVLSGPGQRSGRSSSCTPRTVAVARPNLKVATRSPRRDRSRRSPPHDHAVANVAGSATHHQAPAKAAHLGLTTGPAGALTASSWHRRRPTAWCCRGRQGGSSVIARPGVAISATSYWYALPRTRRPCVVSE